MRKRIYSLIIAVITFFAIFSGFFAVKTGNFAVFADNEMQDAIELGQPVHLMNGSSSLKSDFTPFDFTNSVRMEGKSFKPKETGEHNEFNAEIALNYSQSIEKNDNNVLGIWVYFSTKNLHNLRLTLKGQTESGKPASMDFVINGAQLESMLVKSGARNLIDQPNDGFSWNFIEIPFKIGTATNIESESNEGQLVEFSTLAISFYSLAYEPETKYSLVQFYDAQIYVASFNNLTIKEDNKQPYRFCKFEFSTGGETNGNYIRNENDLRQIYLGDTIKLPSRSACLKYAWVGDVDINNDIENIDSLYTCNVEVINDAETKVWEFESAFTFENTGITNIKFEVTKAGEGEGKDDDVVWQAHTINVNAFEGISFNQAIDKFTLGETVRIFLFTNTNLTQFSDLSFNIASECARIVDVNLELKYIDVRMEKVGDFSIKATAKGKRLFDDNMNMQCERQFTVEGIHTKDNSGLLIAMWVILGCAAVGLIIWGIKTIVTANKYKVR